jgi:RNA polymerase sigma factor (sigma-70 family)
MKNSGDTPSVKFALLLSGEEADFYTCFHVCYDDLYRLGIFLYKDAELVKESIHLLFIELWKMKHKLPDVKNIKEYVLTIYKRILYKQKMGLVKHWSRIEMIDTCIAPNELYIASYEEMMINTQESNLLRNRLLNALPQLAERQKELIRLRYFEEKSIEEIAQITSLTARTIYNTLHNTLVILRELMK